MGQDSAKWTPEMEQYCVKDIKLKTDLVRRLMDQRFSRESIQLEMDVAQIIARQERHGILFEQKKAHALHAELAARKHELTQEFQQVFPPIYVKAQKKEFVPKRDNKKQGYKAGSPMTKIKLQSFNPGSGLL